MNENEYMTIEAINAANPFLEANEGGNNAPFFDAHTRGAEGFFARVCASKKWHNGLYGMLIRRGRKG